MIFNPILSILHFTFLLLTFRIRSGRSYRDRELSVDGSRFLVFRAVFLKDPPSSGTASGNAFGNAGPVVVVLRFRFPHGSLKKDRWVSFFQIPVFAGLPGFEGKVWSFSPETGFFQGIYQWKNEECAVGYLNSFAVRFVKRKAVNESVSARIVLNSRLDQFIRDHGTGTV